MSTSINSTPRTTNKNSLIRTILSTLNTIVLVLLGILIGLSGNIFFVFGLLALILVLTVIIVVGSIREVIIRNIEHRKPAKL